jgi:AcrR family transcriptional regulator
MTKEDKKQKIMEVALELFLKNGFAETPIEAITGILGIAKGSFYTYFSSKEALLNEIVSETINGIEKEISFEIAKNGDPVSSIEKFLKMNEKLAKKYVPGILLAVKEADFDTISDESGIAGQIANKIKNLLKKFVVSLRGDCSNEDLTFIWGIILSFWIESGLSGKTPNIKKLAHKIWYGLGGGVG